MRLINLIPLQEIDFPNQRAFDSYNKIHKLRPDTKVVVAGRVTTAGRASQNSPSPVKGTSVFGGGDKEKSDAQNPQTTIKNIADLTDNNDHNGAVMALAKMMGDKSSIAEMEKIQRYHNSKGHMPQSLIKYRSSILNNLLAQAKKKYGDKFAKQLHGSF
jgi:hypothetical protein